MCGLRRCVSAELLHLYLCLVDIEVNTVLTNITVHKGNPNTTVTYRLIEPYVGRTIDNRNVSLTPEQKVRQ